MALVYSNCYYCYFLFQAGNITDVGDESLPPNLTVIHFNGNPITNISRNAFKTSSNSLNDLIIRSARFNKLPDALLGLENLQTLAIFDTPITDWNIPALQHINKTLVTLNIEAQTGWPTWISNLTSLKSIYILNSQLNPIPDDAFSSIKDSLSTLDLINVSLHTIPKAISQLNLSSLSLSNNGLSDITGIPKSDRMDLSFNALSDADKLVAALLPIGSRIQILYLESNNLTVIPALENVDIERLIISNNQISDHTTGSLPPSLTDLGLAGNRLTLVPTIVTNLPNINTLDLASNLITNISTTLVHPNLEQLLLGYNKISQLLSSDFPVNSSLSYLSVEGNPIVNIPPDALKNLQNLTILNLDSINLNSTPLFLTSLPKLQRLYMDNIPGLNCACPRDESLVKWFSSRKFEDVSGTCSNGANIQDFYNEQDTTRCGVVPLLASLRCMFLCFTMLLLLYMFRM